MLFNAHTECLEEALKKAQKSAYKARNPVGLGNFIVLFSLFFKENTRPHTKIESNWKIVGDQKQFCAFKQETKGLGPPTSDLSEFKFWTKMVVILLSERYKLKKKIWHLK